MTEVGHVRVRVTADTSDLQRELAQSEVLAKQTAKAVAEGFDDELSLTRQLARETEGFTEQLKRKRFAQQTEAHTKELRDEIDLRRRLTRETEVYTEELRRQIQVRQQLAQASSQSGNSGGSSGGGDRQITREEFMAMQAAKQKGASRPSPADLYDDDYDYDYSPPPPPKTPRPPVPTPDPSDSPDPDFGEELQQQSRIAREAITQFSDDTNDLINQLRELSDVAKDSGEDLGRSLRTGLDNVLDEDIEELVKYRQELLKAQAAAESQPDLAAQYRSEAAALAEVLRYKKALKDISGSGLSPDQQRQAVQSADSTNDSNLNKIERDRTTALQKSQQELEQTARRAKEAQLAIAQAQAELYDNRAKATEDPLEQKRYETIAAQIREAIRFKRELAKIDASGLDEKAAKAARELAEEVHKIRLSNLKRDFKDFENEATNTLKKVESKLKGLADFTGLPGLADGIKDSLAEGFQEGLGETAYEGLKQAVLAPFQIAATSVKDFALASFEANKEMESLRSSLDIVSGSTEVGARNFSYISEESDKAGRSILESVGNFTKLAGVAQDTALAGDGVKSIFESLTGAGSKLNLPEDQLSGIVDVFASIIQSGELAAEDFESLSDDLSEGLGKSLPNALTIASEAMGVSREKFTELLEEGTIVVDDFIPKFAEQLNNAVPDGLNKSGRALEKLNAQFENIQVKFGAAIAPLVESGANILTDALGDLGGDGDGIFGPLTREAQLFAADLEGNVELADALKEAFNLASQELATNLVGALRDMTDYLERNPQALADMVTLGGDFLNLLLEMGKAAGFVVDRFARTGEELKILVNGGANKSGALDAAEGAGGSREELDKRIQDKLNNSKIGGIFRPGGEKRDEIIDQVTQEYLSELATANRAAAKAKPSTPPKEAEKLGPPLPEGFEDENKIAKRKPKPKEDKKPKPRVKTRDEIAREALSDQQSDLAESLNNVDADTQSKVAGVRRRQLSDKNKLDAKDAALEIQKIEAESTKKQIAAVEDQFTKVKQLRNSGKINAEEQAKREAELSKNLEGLKRKSVDQEIAYKEAAANRIVEKQKEANQKILEDFERTNAQAQSAIERSQTTRTTAAKRQFLNGDFGKGDAAEKELSNRIASEEETANNQRIALINETIRKTKELHSRGVIDAKEATDRQIALQDDLAQANDKSVELQIAAQERLRKEVLEGIEARTEAAKAGVQKEVDLIQSQVDAQDLLNESLERGKELLESRFGLQKAFSDAQISNEEGNLSKSDRALQLRSKLDDKDLDPNVRRTIQGQLNELGFNSNASEEEILSRKQEVEDRIAKEKILASETEMQFARETLAIEQEREAIAAQIAIFKAESVRLEAELQQITAQGNLEAAQESGDTRKIAAAQREVDLANRSITLADKRLQSEREQQKAQAQSAERARQKLAIEQDSLKSNIALNEQLREQNQQLDLAESKAKSKANAESDAASSGRGKGGLKTFGLGGGSSTSTVLGSAASGSRASDQMFAASRGFNQAVTTAGGAQSNLLKQALGSQKDNPYFALQLQSRGFGDVAGLAGQLGNMSAIKQSSLIGKAEMKAGIGGDVIGELKKLVGAVTDSKTPSVGTLNISSPNPTTDAAQFMSAMSRGNVRRSRL